MVYLCELLRPTYEFWTRSYTFLRYHYGPYNDDIIQRLNWLVFHRLADVKEYGRQRGAVRALYAITDAGERVGDRIGSESRLLPALTQDVVWALQSLGIRSAKDVCSLVYNEPFFASVVRDTAGAATATKSTQLLDPALRSHPSFRLQAIFRLLHTRTPLAPKYLVRDFFSYLATTSVKPSIRQSMPE